jgi:hypothetical protein
VRNTKSPSDVALMNAPAGWTYVFFPKLEIYRMPYPKLVRLMRQALSYLKVAAEVLEKSWEGQTSQNLSSGRRGRLGSLYTLLWLDLSRRQQPRTLEEETSRGRSSTSGLPGQPKMQWGHCAQHPDLVWSRGPRLPCQRRQTCEKPELVEFLG